MEKTILITNVEQKQVQSGKTAGNNYLKITDDKDDWYSVFDKSLFQFCIIGNTVVMDGEQKGKYFNPTAMTPLLDASKLPPPVKPTPPPSHEDEPTTEELATPKPPNPQEIGMFWKELGNRIGDGSIDRDYPNSAAKIKGKYYKKISEVTGVQF